MDEEDKQSRCVSRRTLIAGAALEPVAALLSAAQSVSLRRTKNQCGHPAVSPICLRRE
jgi:hypothetical protein